MQIKGEEKEQADLDRQAFVRMLVAVQFCGCLYTEGETGVEERDGGQGRGTR